jgi:hypothetical protein
MSILTSCDIIGTLVAAGGDGTDVDADPIPLVNPPAWVIGNLGQLWVPGDVRGSDVLMPGAVGVRPFRRRPTVTTHSLPFFVSGSYDYELDEECPDDEWTTLEANLQYLALNLIQAPGTRSGTRDSILMMPSGAERFASIHYLKITPTRVESATLTGTLDISIPEGWFQEAAS